MATLIIDRAMTPTGQVALHWLNSIRAIIDMRLRASNFFTENWSERELGSGPIRSPFALQTGFYLCSRHKLRLQQYLKRRKYHKSTYKFRIMATKDNYSKTLRFSTETDEKLGEIAARLGQSKFQSFNQMVDYFYRTKKDPTDINDELLKKALAKNHDTYIRFIRAQEEKILIPVKVELDRMVASQIKIIDSFNSQVLKANKEI